jgi:hypothetical protein
VCLLSFEKAPAVDSPAPVFKDYITLAMIHLAMDSRECSKDGHLLVTNETMAALSFGGC